MGYIPNPIVDGWVAERRPSLLYRGGEEAREGDSVDFGLDPRQIGIDPAEGPWAGTVLRIDIAAGMIVVDTFCNSVETYPPEGLRLLGRWPEGLPRYSVVGPFAQRKWCVRDDMAGRLAKDFLSRADAEAERDRLNGTPGSPR